MLIGAACFLSDLASVLNKKSNQQKNTNVISHDNDQNENNGWCIEITFTTTTTVTEYL